MDGVWKCAVTTWMVSVLVMSTGMVTAVDHPWTVTLTVSEGAGNDFEGTVEVLGQFENESWSSVVLPFNRYELGREYTFPVSFPSTGPVSLVYLRTRGPCLLGLLPLRSLHLQKLTLISVGTAYAKKLADVVIKDVCEMANDSPWTESVGFDKRIRVADLDTPDDCVLDGVTYSHGQSFDRSCRSRCTCMHGSIECVDKCRTESVIPGQKCRLVRVPRQCCEETRCDQDPRMQTCQLPKNIGALKGEVVNGLRSIQGGVRRYPWAVLLCVDEECKSPFGGAIVSDRHILTFAPDLRDANTLRIASGKYIVDMSLRQQDADLKYMDIRNIHEHPDFARGNGSISPSGARLQLIELWEPLTLNQDGQAANLPLSTAHCSKLSSVECPLMTVGWDTTNTELYQRTKQMYLHAQVSRLDPQLCDSGQFFSKNGGGFTLTKSRTARRTCVSGLSRQDCTGPTGGVMVVTAGDNSDFVIGMLEQRPAPSDCIRTGTAKAISLCRYVDWIADLVR